MSNASAVHKIRTHLFAAGLLTATGLAHEARAFDPQPDPPARAVHAFGVLGLAGGETLQLSVSDTRLSDPPDPIIPAQVTAQLYDLSGNLVHTETAQLAPGESHVLRYTARGRRTDTGLLLPAVRENLRALVSAQLPPGECERPRAGAQRRRCVDAFRGLANLRGSLQVLGGDGSVQVLVDDPVVAVLTDPPDPVLPQAGLLLPYRFVNPPEPIRSALFSVVAGQSVHVHATNTGLAGDGSIAPQPVTVSLHLFDERGRKLLAGEDLRLNPGESTALVWDVPREFDGAAQLRAVIRTADPPEPVRPGASNPPEPILPILAGAVNGVDSSSGRTLFHAAVVPNPTLR